MFGYPAGTALSWINEIRIWAAAIAAVAAVVTGVSSFAQIRLQSIVSGEKDAALEQYKSEAQVSIMKARAEAAKATERSSALEVEALRLRQHMAWRTLTAEQVEVLRAKLQGKDITLWVTTVGGDPEASIFHQQLFDAMKHTLTEQRVHYFNGYQRAVGTTVSATPEYDSGIIQDALTAAGITFNVVPESGMHQKDVVELRIGTRAPPF